MRNRRRKLAALAGVGAVGVVLAAPSPALAKASYGVTITGKQVRVGDTVTVTVTIGDDAGIDAGTRMCLFQIVGDHAPQPDQTDGTKYYYTVPAGSRYVKLADCQLPAPDPGWSDPSSYASGHTKYRLKVTSDGWLALAAFREQNGVGSGVPTLSDVVRVSGPGGAKPGATSAKAKVVSIDPPHEPVIPTPPADTAPAPGGASEDSGTPAAVATETFADDPSSEEAAAEQAAREGRPKLRWLVATATGGFLVGGLLTGVTMTLWSRARAKRT